MNLLRSVELMGKYAICPKCGSGRIGNGQGKLIINDGDYEGKFYRSCKCGWEILIDE